MNNDIDAATEKEFADTTPISGHVESNFNQLEEAITDLILGVAKDADNEQTRSEVFYGRMAAECRRVLTSDSEKDKKGQFYVPTAAVAMHKNQNLLIVNTDFFAKLTRGGRRAVIKHEMQHLVHRHLLRFNDNREVRPNNQQANIGMDAVINQYNPHIHAMQQSDGTTFEEVQYTKIPSAKPNMLWEEYYDLIQKNNEKQKQQQKGKGQGQPQDGEGDNDQYGQTVDDHRFFGEIDEETNRDMMEDALKDSIQRVARGVFAGNEPKEISDILDQIRKESKVPWQVLLRNWMRMATQQRRDMSILKESMSVPDIYPGYKRTPVPEFHVYADMSGSVSDEQATAFFSEILAIQYRMKATVWVHQFDTRIHASQKLERTVPDIKRAACGGTNFACIIEHARKNKNRNVIVMTDGYCGEEDWNGIKTLAVYTKNHQKHGNMRGSHIVLDV